MNIALNGKKFSTVVKERLLLLDGVKEQTVTLSDGAEFIITGVGNEEVIYTGLYSSFEEMETLLDMSFVYNTELQYPENADNFYLRYSDYIGYLHINSAHVMQENVEVGAYIFFFEEPQIGEYRSLDMEIEDELIYEEYKTAQGKQVDIFVDSAGERGMLLLTEENISYEWDFMSSEGVISAEWIKKFADNIQ